MAKSDVSVVLDTEELERRLRALKGQPVRILHDGVEYGIYQHEGFVHWRSGNYVPGKPFFQMALDQIKPELEKATGQAIAKGTNLEPAIEKVARDAQTVARNEAPVDTGNLRNSIDVSKPEDFNV